MTDWRLAASLVQLRAQINAMAPTRSKTWDGSIGDEKHKARKSDHNVNGGGVVCAIDVTHDVAGGCDAGRLADVLVTVKDPRLAYVIWNRRISSAAREWVWRPYSGAPHDHHVHVSVRQDPARYDDPAPWSLSG